MNQGQPSVESPSAETEQKFHNYSGNAIPWLIRVMWLGFWAFAIYYTVQYLFPALRVEIVSPP